MVPPLDQIVKSPIRRPHGRGSLAPPQACVDGVARMSPRAQTLRTGDRNVKARQTAVQWLSSFSKIRCPHGLRRTAHPFPSLQTPCHRKLLRRPGLRPGRQWSVRSPEAVGAGGAGSARALWGDEALRIHGSALEGRVNRISRPTM